MRMLSRRVAALNWTLLRQERFFWLRIREEITRRDFVDERCPFAGRQFLQLRELAGDFLGIGQAQLWHYRARHVFNVLRFQLVQSIAVKPVHLGKGPPSARTVQE